MLFDVVVDWEMRDLEVVMRVDDLTAFAAAMTSRACERVLWCVLVVYEKIFVCGIGGCEKSYGSVLSLCVYK